jgi:NAD-dependent SIR2 family protein deacetylase
MNGTVPICKACKTGVMKPDIVFFGESLPQTFDQSILADRGICDLVVVMGTSLQVHPVAGILELIPYEIPQVYINMESCRVHNFDVELLGPSDLVVGHVCRKLGWVSDLAELQGSDVPEASAPTSIDEHRFLFPL